LTNLTSSLTLTTVVVVFVRTTTNVGLQAKQLNLTPPPQTP